MMPDKEPKFYGSKPYYPTEIAPGTINSILVEYDYMKTLQNAWFTHGADGGPDPGRFAFSPDFISRVLTPGVMEAYGVDPSWCVRARAVASSGDILHTARAVDALVSKAYVNRYGTLPDTETPTPSLSMPDGRPNSVALMKMYREYMTELSAFMKAKNNGEVKKDAKFHNINPEFFAAISTPETLKAFFDETGVPETSRVFNENNSRYGEILRMIKGEQDYFHRTIRPKVFSAQTIKGEFDPAPTRSDMFAARFVKENSIRGARAKNEGGKWPPFSDEMLYFLNDPALLDELGFSQTVKDKFAKANLPVLAPEMRARLCRKGNPVPGSSDIGPETLPFIVQQAGIQIPPITSAVARDLSIAVGREGKALKCVLDLKEEKRSRGRSLPITESTTEKGIIRRIIDENNRSYGMNKHGIVDRMHYPDDVMETIFHPELLPAAREAAQKITDATGMGYVSQSGRVYASLGMIAEQWLRIMPEDSILFKLGLTREMLVDGAARLAANPGQKTKDIVAQSPNPDAIWVAASFCMLAQKNYVVGKGEEFWNRLSDDQARSLRNTIGRNCVERAKQYKKNHPEMFPPRQANGQYSQNNGQYAQGGTPAPGYTGGNNGQGNGYRGNGYHGNGPHNRGGSGGYGGRR